MLQPTEAGIIFRPLTKGLDKENIFNPGLHIIAPWNKIIVYDMREQVLEEKLDILDKKGLSIEIDITLRFVPIKSNIGYLHENFSGDYIVRLINPIVRSSARKVFGRYEAEEIYSTKRAEVESSIIIETKSILESNNIVMKDLLIRSIKLPDQIRAAIDNKEEQRQVAEAMKYKLDKEKLEADRKIIEAEGIAAYNRIVNISLTDKILKQKGIDATVELAKSPNSKVVVVGSGKEGLPLILGGN